MKRALPEYLAQAHERNRFIEMLLNVASDLLSEVRLRIAADRPRPTTQTGAEAGFFRLVGPQIECNVLAPRTACRARRPAIHTGTGDRADELSVAARVAPYNCMPASVVADLGRADLGRAGPGGAWLGAGWLGRVSV